MRCDAETFSFQQKMDTVLSGSANNTPHESWPLAQPHTTKHFRPRPSTQMTPKSSLALVAALLAVLSPSAAIEYTVKTCAELADVDDTLVTSLVIDSSTFVCDEYTRFRVRNGMFLKATGSSVAFSNFAMKVLGELTVEPDVAFTGVNDEV